MTLGEPSSGPFTDPPSVPLPWEVASTGGWAGEEDVLAQVLPVVVVPTAPLGSCRRPCAASWWPSQGPSLAQSCTVPLATLVTLVLVGQGRLGLGDMGTASRPHLWSWELLGQVFEFLELFEEMSVGWRQLCLPRRPAPVFGDMEVPHPACPEPCPGGLSWCDGPMQPGVERAHQQSQRPLPPTALLL